jgi:hypothetical protein
MYTVEDFIAAQPADSQFRLRVLRKLILDAAPHVGESIKYGIPFYTCHGLLCYLNPKKDYVDFGFCRGVQLSDETGLLYGDNKEIRKVKITQLTGPLAESLRQLVYEALLVNGERKKRGARSEKGTQLHLASAP